MKTDFDSIKNCVVVIKPNRKFEIVSNSENKHYKDIFYTDTKSYYSILTKVEDTIIFNLTKRYKICQTNCLISTIILEDVPMNQQYIMRGNGHNLSTAKLINNKPTFKIDSEKRSNMLSTFINLAKSSDEFEIDDCYKYLNIGRICNFGFLTNKQLENKHNIKLTGLYYKDNKWSEDTKNYLIFPYETNLSPIGLTREFIFYGENVFEICLRINGMVYGPFKSNKNCIKFNFDGWCADGKHNKYVSNKINEKVINLNIIDNFSVILISGCKKLSFNKYVYKIYDIETCSNLFV